MRQRADMPNVSCADFITSVLLGSMHHRTNAPTRRCADALMR